jgi:hypothetical protein
MEASSRGALGGSAWRTCWPITSDPGVTGAAGLDQMVADAEDAELYDLPSDVPFERLPVVGDGE